MSAPVRPAARPAPGGPVPDESAPEALADRPRAPQRLAPARGHRELRLGRVSAVVAVRSVLVAVLLVAVLVLAAAADMAVGSYRLSIPQVLAAMTGGGDDAARFVVWELRAPRTTVAALVGVALGVSGALTQTFARNPLASPDVLGIDRGATAGAVLVIVAGSAVPSLAGFTEGVGLGAAALLGGLGTGAVIYALAWRGGVDSTRFVLVGIGVGATLAGLVSWMLVAARVQDAATALRWVAGSLNGRGWDQAGQLGAAVAVLVPVALLLVRRLRVLQLGDETATALGVGVQRSQLLVLAVAVALASASVVAAGPIGFVAFLVPQIALRLVGGSRPPLLASALAGAALVVVADLVGRAAFTQEIPVGLVTTAIGAPYLVALLLRRSRRTTA